MTSPFPGMDPYLEAHWLDVHPALCTYARDSLNAELGNDLTARLGERVVVESLFDRPRGIHPDIRVIEHGGLADLPLTPSAEAVAVAEPLVFEVESEPIRQPFIDIIETGSGKLITAIEFLSPTNKVPGEGRRQYLKKQQEMYNAAVNLVEVDLVRTGEHVLLARQDDVPPGAMATYNVCAFRGWRWGKVEWYSMPLRQRLPAIRIPLRRSDPDVVLDIQALVDQAYRNGRYNRTLDYSRPPAPPLAEEDAAWAREIISRRGR
jgi:hypothetical protein